MNTVSGRFTKPPAAALAFVFAMALSPFGPVPSPAFASPGVATPSKFFEDITARSGLAVRHHNRSFHNPYANIMAGYTSLGAAAAVADFDGDGFEDIFLTDSDEKGTNHLFRNNGNLTFTDVTAAAGLSGGNDLANASADALWLDYDNDGKPDLFVVRFGQSLLYHNTGHGRFEEVTAAAGLTGYRNSITSIAFDYDHDGFADLLVGHYFPLVNLFNPETPKFFPESFETAVNGGGVTLFRNNGNGTFSDVTAKAGLVSSGWTLDVGHGDADGDGWDDLYVACDFGQDHFYVNNHDGTFSDRTKSAIGDDTKKGMNVEWGDYDDDGRLDIFVTNITDDYMREGNFLWRNNGDGTFTDVSRETGTYETGWGWCAKFVDYDNDGWLDLYVMNGWVSAGPDSYVPDIFEMITTGDSDFSDARKWPAMGNKSLSGYEKKRLFHNESGQGFKDEAARHGLDSTRDGRGIAVADFDNDGRLDLFVTNANAEPFFYHNVSPRTAHWIGFSLEGTRSNRRATGAQVRLTSGGRTHLRFVDGGNGFASQSTSRVYFGLAREATIATVEVLWPSGARQTLRNLRPDRIYRLVEGKSGATPFVRKARKK